jgi:hypothetical protein
VVPVLLSSDHRRDPRARTVSRQPMRPVTMPRCWLGEIGAAPEDVVSVVVAVNEAWQDAIEPGHDFAHARVNGGFQRGGDEAFVTVRDAGGWRLAAGGWRPAARRSGSRRRHRAQGRADG